MDSRFFSRLEYWVKANRVAWTEIIQQKSWLRSARQARSLKGVDMAKRMGVSPARISMMESDELRGAVTLKMMQKAAQAMDCEFVYAVIPKKALKDNGEISSEKPRLRVHQKNND
ncbi:MAG: helix-turn-helix domain-containing protein [Gammaproteobacteria bacterium]|nr:helix-turn-helix domain-containing protein [Gammaproteobacteria bacterium]MCK5263413.1 helix-turn-helix domain-containing protein [Gammaproteobacteria bacterium]